MQSERRKGLCRILVGLGFAVSSLTPAIAQLLGPEFQVNSYETNYQQRPDLAFDGSGAFVVVWNSTAQDGSDLGVFGQRYDASGIPAGTEFQINSYTTGPQGKPMVAAASAGDFVVVWASDNQDASSYGIFGKRYDAAGNPQGNEFQINTYTTSTQRAPAVAAGDLGSFVVVWTSDGADGASWGVFGRRYDAAGNPLGNEFQINSHTTDIQWVPAVTASASGAFVVVWPSFGQDGNGWGVFGQRYDSTGTPQGSEFQVNSYTTGDQLYPRVSANSTGDFVVVWSSAPQDGSSDGIFGQRFAASGAPQGLEFQVNTYTSNSQSRPAVAADNAGSFVVTWSSNLQDGSFGGIFGRRFNSAGGPLGNDFQVNVFTTGGQQNPTVAAASSGDFVVAWDSFHDGYLTGVFGRRMTVALFAGDFELGDVCAWNAAVGSGDVCPP